MHANGGVVSFNKIVAMKVLPVEIYSNPKSTMTIPPAKDLMDVGARVFMDTDSARSMLVLCLSETFESKECDEGIYVFDKKDESNKSEFRMNLLQTVNDYKDTYTKRYVKNKDEVTGMQWYYYCPSTDASWVKFPLLLL